jgi:hypothetical protein
MDARQFIGWRMSPKGSQVSQAIPCKAQEVMRSLKSTNSPSIADLISSVAFPISNEFTL